MSDPPIRCPHCGLPHEHHLDVCPTTGLRIEPHQRDRERRRKKVSRDHAREQEEMVGRVIDRKYRLVAAIGEGGMSSIYEAEHLAFDRRVAIKVLHPSLADDPEAVARLQQEAKVVSAIDHQNICQVYDLSRTEEGSPFLVMELLEGESLAERIKAAGPMSFHQLAPIAKQVLGALGAAHEKGILHRDLKPENVFVETSRRTGRPVAKLLDFGISKSMAEGPIDDQRLTHSGMVMGTPYYMAPEQARGDGNLDQRVDLWAVGVVLYEALSGRRPFVANNYNALLVKILTSRPRPLQKLVPGMNEEVVAIVDRALSKLREDRYQHADAFRAEIDRVERLVAVDDPSAPTMAFRRRDKRRGGNEVQAGAVDWSQAIEDPATFVDDDMSVDSSHLAPGTGESGARHEPEAPFDGYVDEHLGETIQDRPPEARLDDTEAVDRTRSLGPLDQEGVGGMGPSDPDTENDPSPAPPAREDAPDGEDRGAKPPGRDRSRRRRRKKRPAFPRSAPDPDENTTLYDIESARARLRERQAARAREDDGGDSSGS